MKKLEKLRPLIELLLTIMTLKKKCKKLETSSILGDIAKYLEYWRYSNLAKYIPVLLELAFQGMPEDIDTKEKTAHLSYTDMEQLDFQILLTENYYINPNGILICFPIKI